jgi:hypothetical protein
MISALASSGADGSENTQRGTRRSPVHRLFQHRPSPGGAYEWLQFVDAADSLQLASIMSVVP